MPRKVRDAALETRSARAKLKAQKKPFYRLIEPGLHLGYRKLANKPGTWLVRRYAGGGVYTVKNLLTADGALVIADDGSDADGEAIMTFGQAQTAAKAFRPEARQTKGPYTIAHALADYFAFLREEGRPEHLVRSSESRAEALIIPRLGPLEVETLSAKRLRVWRDGLVKTAPLVRSRKGEPPKHRETDHGEDALRARRASANRVWTILRSALNRAFEDGKVASDKEWRKVRPFRGVDGTRPHWLTLKDAKRVINAANSDFRLLVQAALKTGGRYGALAKVKVRDFHEGAGIIDLRTRKGDGTEKTFKVVLTSEGTAFFRQVCAGRRGDELIFVKANRTPWQRSEQTRPMLEVCQRARIKPAIGFNQLRHTWASLSVMNGVPLMVVAQNLGHADTRMVEKHYGHLAPSYVADAIRAGAPKFGITAADTVQPLR